MRFILGGMILVVAYIALFGGSQAPQPDDTLAVSIPVAVAMGSEQNADTENTRAENSSEALTADSDNFKRVSGTRTFSFPADHAAHPGYRTEWWYIVGNLSSEEGQEFGFQFTLFRNGLRGMNVQTASDAEQRAVADLQPWQVETFYMGHAGLSDLTNQRFFSAEKFARSYADIAGDVAGEPTMWLHDWQVRWEDDAWHFHIAARGKDGTPFAYDFTARPLKDPVLRGAGGLSQKSAEPGNASWYYAQPRMDTSGTITVDGDVHAVSGLSWLDREWSTSALGPNQIGWDWFALHLDDGRDLMVYRMRLRDGTTDATSHGGLTLADGSEIHLALNDMVIEPLGYWTSPATKARYPIQWRIQVPQHNIDVLVSARMDAQEHRGIFSYWEGSVRVQAMDGKHIGLGYLEMTGHGDDLQARPD